MAFLSRVTILPGSAYSKLASILGAPNAMSLFASGGPHNSSPGAPYLSATHLGLLISHLHQVSLASSTLIPYLEGALRTEVATFAENLAINASTSPNTLFRGNTTLTKTMEFAMMHYGRPWLDKSLGTPIRRLISERICIDTDVIKIEKRSKREMGDMTVPQILEINVRLLVEWCTRIWGAINNARDYCPKWVHARRSTHRLV